MADGFGYSATAWNNFDARENWFRRARTTAPWALGNEQNNFVWHFRVTICDSSIFLKVLFLLLLLLRYYRWRNNFVEPLASLIFIMLASCRSKLRWTNLRISRQRRLWNRSHVCVCKYIRVRFFLNLSDFLFYFLTCESRSDELLLL